MKVNDNWISGELLIKYILLVLIGFSVSQIFFNNENANKSSGNEYLETSNSAKEIRLKEKYEYINPLLECTDNIDGKFISDSVKNEINTYVKTQKDQGITTQVSVYFRDLNNGPWFGIDEKELFTPASLTKVPMMILYFKKAESDPSILEQELTISNSNVALYKDQITIPSKKLVENGRYTIQYLIEQMIYYSDNVAYTALKNNLKEYELNKLFLDFGIDISSRIKDPNENIISVREYASFFRILYNASYLNREYSEKALDILSKTTYDRGITAGISNNETKVAHKFGEKTLLNQNQLHDCGIVYNKENPYLLCVMTRGNNLDKLPDVIKNISEIIYRYRN